jgi:hypothetical protein
VLVQNRIQHARKKGNGILKILEEINRWEGKKKMKKEE